jgi:hypothetical protein
MGSRRKRVYRIGTTPRRCSLVRFETFDHLATEVRDVGAGRACV